MKIENHILYKKNLSKFEELKTCIQDINHHGEGNVFTHTQMVMDSLLNSLEYSNILNGDSISEYSKSILEYCTMLHDIEKPKTRCEEIIGGVKRITHRKHGKYGAKTSYKMLTEMNYDIKFIWDVYNLILHHGKPFWIFNKNNPTYEIIKLSHQTRIDWLYIFAKADLIGRICNDQEEILLNLDLMKELAIELDCYNKPYEFKTLTDKFDYFNNDNSYPDKYIKDYFDYHVVMMCGIPASGKSSYIKEKLNKYKIISTDNIRLKNNYDFSKQSFSKIFDEVYKQIDECCRNHTSFVIDATNTRKDLRQKLLNRITSRKDGKGMIEIVWCQKTLEECIKDNSKRNEYVIVDNKYIIKSYYSFEQPTETESHKITIC